MTLFEFVATMGGGERGRGVGAYSFVPYLSRLTIDHAPLSRRSNVPGGGRE